MPKQGRTWIDVWALVRARQRQFGWSDAELYVRCSISQPTYTKGREIGKPLVRPDKISGLEDGLRWARGSVQQILDGGEPTEIEPPALVAAPLVTTVEELSPSQLARVEAVSETMQALDRRVENLEKALAAVEARLDTKDGRSLPGGT